MVYYFSLNAISPGRLLDTDKFLYTMFPQMGDRPFSFRLSAVQDHLNNGMSIAKTAVKWNVHPRTVYKWLKIYRIHGEFGLLSNYNRPWNRIERATEEKIAFLKENNPSLTVRRAQKILRSSGIKISLKGIWNIWKRYGYAGFDKNSLDPNLTQCTTWNKEAKMKYHQAIRLFDSGNITAAADLLNSIPALPANELLIKIPDEYLNLKRRIEKYLQLFQKIPLSEFLDKMESLYSECIEDNLYFSSLKAGIMLGGALSYAGKWKEFNDKIKKIKKVLKPCGNYFSNILSLFKYVILIGEGIARVIALDYNGAWKIIRECGRIIRYRRLLPSEFPAMLATLYTWVQDYRHAERLFCQALSQASEENKAKYMNFLTIIRWHKGDYLKDMSIFKRTEFQVWGAEAMRLFFEGVYSLINGKPEAAISLSLESLKAAKKEELINIASAAYLVMASAYSSLGMIQEGMGVLKGIYHLSKKSRHWGKIITLIVSKQSKEKLNQIIKGNYMPLIKIAALLRSSNYQKALALAHRKYLVSDFLLLVPFFSHLVIREMEIGRNPKIPRSMFTLPVFNRNILVYNLRILGDLVVYRKNDYLKVKLSPKDTAFLIHFAIKADSPGKKVPLVDIFQNFWPKSETPKQNLSHLLVRIKKSLKIPTYLVNWARVGADSYIINQGIHFATDIDEFKQLLAGAKVFLNGEKWEIAREHFWRAFRLFRGQPFRKNFDEWSLNYRFMILNHFESEAINFAKICLEHGDKNDAKRILQRVLKIMPDSEEARRLLQKIT
ncbi:MAG: helix-turn-helix domain-containing protein [candidate division WOR-3 bacterium]